MNEWMNEWMYVCMYVCIYVYDVPSSFQSLCTTAEEIFHAPNITLNTKWTQSIQSTKTPIQKEEITSGYELYSQTET